MKILIGNGGGGGGSNAQRAERAVARATIGGRALRERDANERARARVAAERARAARGRRR